jgi:hypothetical protein
MTRTITAGDELRCPPSPTLAPARADQQRRHAIRGADAVLPVREGTYYADQIGGMRSIRDALPLRPEIDPPAAVRPNTIVRFDPKTEKFQTFAIPSGGGVLRHFEATADGNIVTANSGVNKIALVEIGALSATRSN